jgi:hypothetical protein
MNNYNCLKEAIEITKEYAKGGGTAVDAVLEAVYEKLKKLAEDTKV